MKDHARAGSVGPLAIGDPDHVWEALFDELSGRPQDSLPEVAVALSGSRSSAVDRLARTVALGYTLGRKEAETLVLVPQPVGVLWLVDRPGSALSSPGFLDGRFRRYVLVLEDGAGDGHRLSDALEELWCLPDFLDRGAVPEFVVEFLATRPVQVVQIAGSRLAADLLPTLMHSFPHLHTVADLTNDQEGLLLGRYLVSHYGNLVDRFWVPDEATREGLVAQYISGSKTVVGPPGGGPADLRASLYGRLVASDFGVELTVEGQGTP